MTDPKMDCLLHGHILSPKIFNPLRQTCKIFHDLNLGNDDYKE